jgi:hypothetical protein
MMSNSERQPVQRREFIETALAAVPTLAFAVARRSSVRARDDVKNVDDRATVPTSATRDLVARYGRLMKEKGLKRQAVTGRARWAARRDGRGPRTMTTPMRLGSGFTPKSFAQ